MSRCKLKRKERSRPPFFRGFGYYIQSIFSFAICVLIMFFALFIYPPEKLSDYLAFVGVEVIFGGYGLLILLVGLKKRRWKKLKW